MKQINLREAKATLSAILDDAEHGEATTITRYGKAVAVLVPVEQAHKLYPEKPSLVDHLLSFPGWPDDFELERNSSPSREVVDL